MANGDPNKKGDENGIYSFFNRAFGFFEKVLEAIWKDTRLCILWGFGVLLLVFLVAVLALASDLSTDQRQTVILAILLILAILIVITIILTFWDHTPKPSWPPRASGVIGLPKLKELLPLHPEFDGAATPPEEIRGDLVLYDENGSRTYLIATTKQLYFVVDSDARSSREDPVHSTLRWRATTPKVETYEDDNGVPRVDIDYRRSWLYNTCESKALKAMIKELHLASISGFHMYTADPNFPRG